MCCCSPIVWGLRLRQRKKIWLENSGPKKAEEGKEKEKEKVSCTLSLPWKNAIIIYTPLSSLSLLKFWQKPNQPMKEDEDEDDEGRWRGVGNKEVSEWEREREINIFKLYSTVFSPCSCFLSLHWPTNWRERENEGKNPKKKSSFTSRRGGYEKPTHKKTCSSPVSVSGWDRHLTLVLPRPRKTWACCCCSSLVLISPSSSSHLLAAPWP